MISRPISSYFTSRFHKNLFLYQKKNYVKQQAKTSEVLEDATMKEQTKIITLLPRHRKKSERVEPDEKLDKNPQSSPLRKEIIKSAEVSFKDEAMADRKKQTRSPEKLSSDNV